MRARTRESPRKKVMAERMIGITAFDTGIQHRFPAPEGDGTGG